MLKPWERPGEFIRAMRDSIQPESLGLPERGRRRSPGLRRLDLAERADISVEYLTRLEQGRDRNPSPTVIDAIADALRLEPSECNHLRYLAKITGGECSTDIRPAPPSREVRPAVLKTLELLEPGHRYRDQPVRRHPRHTSAYASATRGTGLLDTATPTSSATCSPIPVPGHSSSTGMTSRMSRPSTCGSPPSLENLQWLTGELTATAGDDFIRRLKLATWYRAVALSGSATRPGPS